MIRTQTPELNALLNRVDRWLDIPVPTDDELDRALADAEPVPLTGDEIRRMVSEAVSGGPPRFRQVR